MWSAGSMAFECRAMSISMVAPGLPAAASAALLAWRRRVAAGHGGRRRRLHPGHGRGHPGAYPVELPLLGAGARRRGLGCTEGECLPGGEAPLEHPDLARVAGGR